MKFQKQIIFEILADGWRKKNELKRKLLEEGCEYVHENYHM